MARASTLGTQFRCAPGQHHQQDRDKVSGSDIIYGSDDVMGAPPTRGVLDLVIGVRPKANYVILSKTVCIPAPTFSEGLASQRPCYESDTNVCSA